MRSVREALREGRWRGESKAREMIHGLVDQTGQDEMLSGCSYAIEFLFSLCCAHFLTYGFPSHALVRYSSALVNL